ncbi:16S rRNA (uracil(1498)-N(3))-methyltransferase [Pseudaquabacterium rugosum]|uniref:Ribosomal RNA small subunit methyltransferase E n=1 Tax=Pseudaquabacterium rugosum TaxID=2984194 RepID=A0ABU9B9G6_9BURK
MATRFHVDVPLSAGVQIVLPPNATRHVQVLRLQPGAALTLFDGLGGQWQAEVLAMGRREVTVQVLAHAPVECELPVAVTLALGMPANERMDTVVEKAAELGAAGLQPLVCERSVLRVAGDRAQRKSEHWQAVAVSACEQSGRNRVPEVAAAQPLRDWLRGWAAAVPGGVDGPASPQGLLLSLDPQAPPLWSWLAGRPRAVGADCAWQDRPRIVLLSGPEGGLSSTEQAAAVEAGFQPVSLGSRVLRADTAPLAALSTIACWAAARIDPSA